MSKVTLQLEIFIWSIFNPRQHQFRLYDNILAHVWIVFSNTIICLVTTLSIHMWSYHTPHPPSYFQINEPQRVTLPYKYICYIFSRGPSYMYISMSYNLYSIWICDTKEFKLLPVLGTHIYSCVLWRYSPWGWRFDKNTPNPNLISKLMSLIKTQIFDKGVWTITKTNKGWTFSWEPKWHACHH